MKYELGAYNHKTLPLVISNFVQNFFSDNISLIPCGSLFLFNNKIFSPDIDFTYDTATYCCPCVKMGLERLSKTFSSVCPWHLFYLILMQDLQEISPFNHKRSFCICCI